MNKQKVDKVVEQLMRAGFSMTTREFYATTAHKIMRRYGVDEKLTREEYCELLRQLLEICAENDLKNMGIGYFDEDDWEDK